MSYNGTKNSIIYLSYRSICFKNTNTVNVDIFASINFRAFAKIGILARIYIRVFDIIDSIWHNKSYFRDVLIFADILKTRITRKYRQREKFYIHSMFTQANSGM